MRKTKYDPSSGKTSSESWRRHRPPLIQALEPRIMFDAAVVADATAALLEVETSTDAAQPAESSEQIDQDLASEVGAPLFSQSGARREVVFVDVRLGDYQQVVDAASPTADVILIDTGSNGVQQIADALAGRTGIDAIHIVSHGGDGVLLLGNSPLHTGNLADHAAQLESIGAALSTDGDILLYGCDVGASEKGISFLSALAEATGAEVAASADSTGGGEGGGNWELEVTTGQVAASYALDTHNLRYYDHQLATFSVSTIGELRTALSTSATNGAADTITFLGNIIATGTGDMLFSSTDGHRTFVDINIADGQALDIVGGGYTLDANYYGRVMEVRSGTVSVSNLTIRDGLVAAHGGNKGSFGSDALGGAIRNAGTLTLSGVAVTASGASGGGGGGGSGVYAGGGGGGGGGLSGIGGGNGGTGGTSATNYAGESGGGGVGGAGGDFTSPNNTAHGGRGGSTTGGAGGAYAGYASGGGGGSASNGSLAIGGGGGGAAFSDNGGRGGHAAGAVYNAGTLTILSSTVSNNVGAAGGGGAGAVLGQTGVGGNGGTGVGGLWNEAGATLRLDSTSNGNLASNAGAGGSGGSGQGNGVAGTGNTNIYNLGTLDTNYSPNTVPTATNLTQTVTYTEDPGGNVALGDIVVSDADAGDTITATLTLSNPAAGVVTTGTFGSATSTYNAGTGVWTVTGSVTDVNAALAAAAFTPASNWTTDVTVTTRIRDAANTGPADGTITLDVTAVNDAPTATNLTQSKAVAEGGSAVALDDIVVSDVDTGETVTATLTLSDPAAGSLSTGTFGAATSTYDAATGAWTVAGSVSDVNAALAAVALTPSANNEQNFTITTRIRDAANTGPADGTVSITVTSVNDAPTATNLTQTATYTEDPGGSVSLADIVVTDIDSGETVTATLTLGNAAAGSLNTGTFGSATSTYNAGTGIWTVTGSVTDVNAALAAVAFTPAANWDQDVTISTRIRDAANVGPADGTITLDVAPVNDAPTATNLTQTVTYTEDPGGSVALGDIVVTDVDTGDAITATLTLSNAAAGSLTSGTFGSATSSYNAGTGTWTVIGSVTDVNAALAAVAFTPAANWDQDVTISTRIRDAANVGPAEGTITLDVTPVNDAPAVTTSGGSTAYTENASAAAIDAGLTLVDVDSAALASATVSITGGFVAGQDILGFTNDPGTMGNISASYDAASGTLTLTSAGGTATVAQWQTALRSVTYSNSSESPGTANRTISFAAHDGAAAGSAATKTVTITAVNDAPSTDAANGYLNTGGETETSGLLVVTNAMLREGDPDDSGTGITYTLTSAPTGGTLFLDLNGNGTVDGGETLMDASTFTQDDVDQGRIKYRHAGGAGSSDSFTFSVADGGEDGAAALTGLQFNISIAERPVVSVGAGSPSYTEDGPATVIASGLTITDGDSANMAGATVTISDYVSGDTLGFTDQNGITGSFNVATGILTLTGTATREQYQAALRSVIYSSTSDNPATYVGNNNRVIEFRVSDGGLQSAPGTSMTVAVANANDAPALDASQSPVLTGITEDRPAPANGNTTGSTLVSDLLGGATDPDIGSLSGIAIIGASNQGTLWYSTDGGTTWTQAPAVSEANALLLQSDARVYFQPAANLNGTVSDAITFRAWDRTSGANGGTANTTTNGGASAFSTATDTASITISAINDAPTINTGPFELTGTNENTASAATNVSAILTGLGSTDADGDSLGIAIAGASGNGNWQYSTNGSDWYNVGAVSTSNSLLLAANAQIRYNPDGANGEVGGAAPTLSFRAWDGSTGGATAGATRSTMDTTTNGGSTAYSATQGSASIQVSAVNDAPSINPGTTFALTTTNEDAAASSPSPVSDILTGANRTDVDTGALSGIAVTATTGNGIWQYSTDGTTWTDFGSVSGGAALLLSSTSQVRYVPNGLNGETATFTWRAWDQTSGTASANGARATGDTSTSGGSSAFSANTGQAAISVSPVNDAPVVAAPASISVTEETASPLTGISFTDADSGSGTVTVTLSVGSGSLAATSGSGVTIGGTSTALTLSGSIADINAFVAASNVTFQNALNVTSDVTLTAGINDGGNTGTGGAMSDSATITLNVSAVNDAPAVTAPPNIGVTEDVATPLTGISFADVDAGSGAVTVTLSVGSGSIVATSGSGVTVGGTASALTLNGSIADINAFIAASSVTFQTAPHAASDVTLTVGINDGGNSGSGGAQTASTTVTLNVSAVNDAPVLTGITVPALRADVGQPFTFTLPAGLFTEVDAGDALTFSIGNLPAGLVFDPASGTISGTPSLTASGTYTLTIVATDSVGASTSTTVTLTVSPPPAVVPPPSAAPAFPPPPLPPAPPEILSVPSPIISAFAPGGPAGMSLLVSTPGDIGAPSGLSFETGDIFNPGSPAAPNFVGSGAPPGFISFEGSGLPNTALAASPSAGEFAVGTSQFSVALPPATFTHSEEGARVTVEANQADGSPLPQWIRFDPATGTFRGTAPAGFTGSIDIRVIARDSEGRQAESRLQLRFDESDGNGSDRTPSPLPVQGQLQGSSGEEGKANDQRAPLRSGKPSLNEQFALHGRGALESGKSALLKSAQAAALKRA